ncbi:MAG: tRNA (adenosine(37)-N6)-threonylcarbamoyltransferase complex transferase subunit TsaD [Patescibacteria group bacterium]|nr:tRNA (adenosine(37)-N6)-threonylcarbamoyltransferase complex transferase subunit TsaD [Patescibacteria group bacterium]
MQKRSIKILAIESSCDDTCAAIIDVIANIEGLFLNEVPVDRAKRGNRLARAVEREGIIRDIRPTIVSNIISSQVKLHARYGGVYPELASREHLKNILPVIEQALNRSMLYGVSDMAKSLHSKPLHHKPLHHTPLNLTPIDYLAVTTGPGLIGSLLPGANTAKTLSYIFNKPIYPINHLEGHIYANFIGTNPESQTLNPKPLHHTSLPHTPIQFPLIALIVSGGHTSLIYMKNHLNYKVIGETLDDAAGEAFDKLAKMLDLGYPGGPVVSQMADKVESRGLFLNEVPVDRAKRGNRLARAVEREGIIRDETISFPRPMINSDNFNFSFSGLKTSALYTIQKLPKPLASTCPRRQQAGLRGGRDVKSLICHEFQNAIVETLVNKTIRAAKKYKAKTILLAGGVAANDELRNALHHATCTLNLKFFVPPKNLCTDNAAMIGTAAAYKIAFGVPPTPWYNVNSDSNLKL